MLKQYVSSLSSAGSDTDIVGLASPRSEPLPLDDLGEFAEDAGAMAQTVRDQLAREVADIEAATGVAPHRRALAVDGAGHRRRGRRHRLAGGLSTFSDFVILRCPHQRVRP